MTIADLAGEVSTARHLQAVHHGPAIDTERAERAVAIGASLAGAKAAEAARAAGYDGRVVLIGDELGRPYERPPLSKDVLRGEKDTESTRVHEEAFYADHDIALVADRARPSSSRAPPSTPPASPTLTCPSLTLPDPRPRHQARGTAGVVLVARRQRSAGGVSAGGAQERIGSSNRSTGAAERLPLPGGP